MSVEIPERLQGRYVDLIKAAHKKGDYLYIKVSLPKRGRSTGKNSQCNHINGHVRFISEETDQGIDSVKMAMKILAMDRGYPGDMIGDVKIPISEADASVENAKILIDTIHQFADEWFILLPEENWDEQETT